MRSSQATGLTAFLLMIGSATSVGACINDRNVEISEREFKSSYMGTDDSPSPSSSEEYSPYPDQDLTPFIAGSGVGAVLLVGASGLCLTRRPKVS